MSVKGRRRGFQSILVEPYRQVKLGLFFVIVNISFSLLILGVFGYYIYDIFKSIETYFQLTNQESFMTLSKLATPITVAALLLIGFVTLTIYISIRYTHKIYGPLVNIHRFLDDILEGRKPKQIILRESDQLQDLATKLNKVAEMVQKK